MHEAIDRRRGLSLGILFGSTGTALATHCYVADKPAGAGTNGAFQREEGDPVDTFQWDLPDPAHERGSQIRHPRARGGVGNPGCVTVR